MYRVFFSFLFISSFFISDIKAQSQYVYTKIDVNPGPGDSRPYYITAIDSFIYFFADDGTHGKEPWISDGTQAGTRLLKDLTPGQFGDVPWFGTFIKLNGKVYFSGGGPDGEELWETDGTTAGTKVVADINPGPGSSKPAHMILANGLMYFSADDGTHGREPWVSDGTANGTKLLRDIRKNGSGHSTPEKFIEFNGKVYFTAYDGNTYYELWETDGTPNGTVMHKSPGLSTLSDINHFKIFNNKLYFSAAVGPPYGYGLISTDGTAASTKFVANTEPTSTDGIESPMTIYKNELYFSSSDGAPNHSFDLWKSDGSSAQMKQVKDIYPGKNGASDPSFMAVVNNKLLFIAKDDKHGRELWASDGTEPGTKMVKDIRKQPNEGNAYAGLRYGDKYLFIADDTNTSSLLKQLYISDGTDTGTRFITPPFAVAADKIYVLNGYPNIISKKLGVIYTVDYDDIGKELMIVRDTTIKDTTTTPPQTVAQVSGTDNEITITPNPAHDNVHIALAKAVSNAEITLTDISGKVVRHKTIIGSTKDIDFELPKTTSGIYILNIQDSNSSMSKRLLIE